MIWSDQVDLLVLLLDSINIETSFISGPSTGLWLTRASLLLIPSLILICLIQGTACCRVIASTGPLQAHSLQAHSLQVTHLCVLWSRHQPVIITFLVLILCKRSIYKYNLECAPFFSSSYLISFKWDMRLTFLPPGCFISRALSICCVLLLSLFRDRAPSLRVKYCWCY